MLMILIHKNDINLKTTVIKPYEANFYQVINLFLQQYLYFNNIMHNIMIFL